MRIAIFRLAAGFGLLALTGCVTSPRALSSHDLAVPDTRLLGEWKVMDSSGNRSLFHITTQGNWMQFDVRPLAKAGEKAELPSDYLGFPTHLAGHDFMNILAIPGPTDSFKPGYVFYPYSIKGSHLEFGAMSNDELKRLAAHGRIHLYPVAGSDGKPTGDYAIVESMESLDRFIESADLKKLFSGGTMEAVRVGSGE